MKNETGRSGLPPGGRSKRKVAMTTLTAERARELLDYDSETGALTWKVGKNAGKRAGVRPNKYGSLVVGIDGIQHYQHRVAWLIVHGEWPEFEIDHINRNPADNRLCNLRDVTRSDNVINRGTFIMGIRRVKDKWMAKVNGERFGPFETREAAVEAHYRASIARNAVRDQR